MTLLVYIDLQYFRIIEHVILVASYHLCYVAFIQTSLVAVTIIFNYYSYIPQLRVEIMLLW